MRVRERRRVKIKWKEAGISWRSRSITELRSINIAGALKQTRRPQLCQ